MAGKYATIQQHEPLRVPESWGTQEKRFVAQLEEILDDIYRRFGRLKETDLGGALRKTISDAEGNIATLKGDSQSFTAAFQSIGTMGKQTGITKATRDGVEVQHSGISTVTKMNADGFKICDMDGKEIGGLVVIDGKVYLAAQNLMRPDRKGFRIGVAEKDFDGEQMGLHWIFDGAEQGAISAHSGGMRFDSGGDISLYPAKRFQVNSVEGFFIYGPNGSGIEVLDNGEMYLHFTFTDQDGSTSVKRMSMQFLYETLMGISPD